MPVNYQNGKVYKITCDVEGLEDQCYVGSTAIPRLSTRMSHHRTSVRMGITSTIYTIMREHGVEHFNIILLESCPCNSRDELNAREDYYIRLLNSKHNGWNTNDAVVDVVERNRLKKEYYETNKTAMIAKQNLYYKTNKAAVATRNKLICEANIKNKTHYCDTCKHPYLKLSHLNRHNKTKGHIAKLANPSCQVV
jgi:group I intron endonuclease